MATAGPARPAAASCCALRRLEALFISSMSVKRSFVILLPQSSSRRFMYPRRAWGAFALPSNMPWRRALLRACIALVVRTCAAAMSRFARRPSEVNGGHAWRPSSASLRRRRKCASALAHLQCLRRVARKNRRLGTVFGAGILCMRESIVGMAALSKSLLWRNKAKATLFKVKCVMRRCMPVNISAT